MGTAKASASVAASVALGERLLLLPGVGPPSFHRTLGALSVAPQERLGSDGSFP